MCRRQARRKLLLHPCVSSCARHKNTNRLHTQYRMVVEDQLAARVAPRLRVRRARGDAARLWARRRRVRLTRRRCGCASAVVAVACGRHALGRVVHRGPATSRRSTAAQHNAVRSLLSQAPSTHLARALRRWGTPSGAADAGRLLEGDAAASPAVRLPIAPATRRSVLSSPEPVTRVHQSHASVKRQSSARRFRTCLMRILVFWCVQVHSVTASVRHTCTPPARLRPPCVLLSTDTQLWRQSVRGLRRSCRGCAATRVRRTRPVSAPTCARPRRVRALRAHPDACS